MPRGCAANSSASTGAGDTWSSSNLVHAAEGVAIFRFVGFRLREDHGDGARRRRLAAPGDRQRGRHHRRRIDAAAEEHRGRRPRTQPRPGRALEQRPAFVGDRAIVAPLVRRVRFRTPVAAEIDPLAGRDQQMTRRNTADAAEQRPRPGRRLEMQHTGDRLRVRRGHAAHREQRADVGGQAELAGALAPVERPHAQAIARRNQGLRPAVPDEQREVAVQAVGDGRAAPRRHRQCIPRIVIVATQRRFGRGNFMTVVQTPVEDHRVRAVWLECRLRRHTLPVEDQAVKFGQRNPRRLPCGPSVGAALG